MKLHYIVVPFIVGATSLHLRSQQGCECDDFINPSGWGNCIKEEDGKPMCYVKNPSTSTCRDLVTSDSDVTRKWSFEACLVPPTTTGCKTDDDCTGEETCINGKCACGNQQSCMGDVSAPICDSANSLCKCSVLAKGRFGSCANQEKSPICDVAGHKCTCGTKGPCKGEEVCHQDEQGTGYCKEKLCGAVACGPGETCDEFAKICRCGTGPSCVGFERAPECKNAMIVAPEDCANAKNKKECCATAKNKKGCEDGVVAPEDCANATNKKECCAIAKNKKGCDDGVVAPEDCANAKNKKECCAIAKNKKGCENGVVASEDCTYAKNKKECCSNANNKKGCEDGVVASEDCTYAKNKKECCSNANNKKGCEDAGIAKVLSQTVTMKCKCGDQEPCDKGLKCVKEKCVKI